MFRARQRFGKYIIERKIAEGGFAIVYQARDTIEGIRVAIKMPYEHLISSNMLDEFRQEVRLVARLDHPNILPLKYADYIDGKFVIITALGDMSLDDRLSRRLSPSIALDYADQMIAAVAYAHSERVVHCDIKPDNFLIFPGHQIRLTDFGIARVAQHTLKGSGAGTLGYVAPEQAMGQVSPRSDVFSLGITIYRMLTGRLPSFPYEWPLEGYDRLRAKVHPDFISVLQRAMESDARRRFRDAVQFEHAYDSVRSRALKATSAKTPTGKTSRALDWRAVQRKEFLKLYGAELEAKYECDKCSGPVSESMHACPWCGKKRKKHNDDTKYPQCCPRCHRGMKLDWVYCPWCYGPGFEPSSERQYSDKRYTAKCTNAKCERKLLMPFMRYCPWCQTKVRRRWQLHGSGQTCQRCGWGVAGDHWSYCPWCTKALKTIR
ncbi:serine/threonine protein kinase [Aeoliella mucimassa]|uniref:Serine/threonine-protein kinase PrkC n=1 Tax=Aeoliella mucimassa TaxID=2527972 RepID=A0A518AJ69_9BACT|nr:serine/threonine-protein kinase [Aeoliella mucimassa]QDU54781.1 Serine/threonine-protein kinase PrkC [Aeoliella mucimassa]